MQFVQSVPRMEAIAEEVENGTVNGDQLIFKGTPPVAIDSNRGPHCASRQQSRLGSIAARFVVVVL